MCCIEVYLKSCILSHTLNIIVLRWPIDGELEILNCSNTSEVVVKV